MRSFLSILFILTFFTFGMAQDSSITARKVVVGVTNSSSTGTTVNRLAKLSGAPSKALIAATTDTDGVIGIIVAGAGTSGIATIQTEGIAPCAFDGATTANDYVGISSSTAGKCHDAGSSYPTSGQVVGRVLSTNGSAGTYSVLLGAGYSTVPCATCVTSASSSTANRLMVGAGSQASTVLGSLGTTTTVLHGNASGAPTFGAVSLSTDVTGNLPVTNNTVSVLDGSVAYCADAGASDAYACSLSPAPASYVTGARYRFKANTANTGAATINLNSLGAKAIKKAAGGITTDLADNDIRVGQVVDLVYDGTNMQMQSTLGNAGSGLASINGDSTAAQVIAAGNGISITDAGATHTIAVTGEHLLSTTTVNTNVGTKQALYTVPVGKHCIVTKIVVRSVSASLGAMSDALSFGFDVDAGDFNAPLNSTALSTLTDNTLALTLHNDAEITLSPVKIGSAGNVFGCFFNDTSITATVVIDVFGYLY